MVPTGIVRSSYWMWYHLTGELVHLFSVPSEFRSLFLRRECRVYWRSAYKVSLSLLMFFVMIDNLCASPTKAACYIVVFLFSRAPKNKFISYAYAPKYIEVSSPGIELISCHTGCLKRRFLKCYLLKKERWSFFVPDCIWCTTRWSLLFYASERYFIDISKHKEPTPFEGKPSKFRWLFS